MIGKLLSALLMLVVAEVALAAEYPFTLHKLKSNVPGPTLLVVGGIQGDEPGGFTAASLLVTDYQVSRGEIWVVPNLNFESIIKRSRGVHGDMNRKFLDIARDDPEFHSISKIKGIITANEVDMVLNLHDGSGFYNPQHIDKDENPRRWGQSIVIDQSIIDSERFGNLENIANSVITRTNSRNRSTRENFHLKNTHTSMGDKEMEKTLTYFAIRNGKAAMGVEASKSYPTARRIFNHLRFVESMLDQIGIHYQRDFQLSAKVIKQKLGRDIKLAMFENKIFYDFDKARKNINYVPIKKQSSLQFRTNNPLVAIDDSTEHLKVRYGNRSVTTLNPQYFDYDHSLSEVSMDIDGRLTRVSTGTQVAVEDEFMVHPIPGQRVNIIGFRKAGQRDESGLKVRRSEIASRFSVDNDAQKFRVEFYRKEKYSGMILLDFSDRSSVSSSASESSPSG